MLKIFCENRKIWFDLKENLTAECENAFYYHHCDDPPLAEQKQSFERKPMRVDCFSR
jgi:hypothetical protein